jgi:hypothetical protein
MAREENLVGGGWGQVKEILPRAKSTMPADLRQPLLARAKKYDLRLAKNKEAFDKEQADALKSEPKKQDVSKTKVQGEGNNTGGSASTAAKTEEPKAAVTGNDTSGAGSRTAENPLPSAQAAPASLPSESPA